MRIAILCGLLVCSLARAETFVLDPANSDLTVHVRRRGLLSAFEHDHFLHPRRWSGRLELDREHPESARVEVIVDAASLADAQPKLSAGDREKVEQQIRSPAVLDAARFAEVRFTAERLEVSEAAPGRDGSVSGVLVGTLALHGREEPLALTFHARWSDAGAVATGHAEFDQSRYGISPQRKAGGAIGVQDRVAVDVSAVFAPEERP